MDRAIEIFEILMVKTTSDTRFQWVVNNWLKCDDHPSFQTGNDSKSQLNIANKVGMKIFNLNATIPVLTINIVCYQKDEIRI